MPVADIVIVSLIFDKLVGELLHIVDVEVIPHDTVLYLCFGSLGNDHLPLGVEGVLTGRKSGPGQYLIQIQRHILGKTVAIADIVVATVILNDLISNLPNTLIVEIIVVRAGQKDSLPRSATIVI